MPANLKLNKGMVEKLQAWKTIRPEESKSITNEELDLQIDDHEIAIDLHEKDKRILEISDVNGSFELTVDLNKEKIEKLRKIVERLDP